VTTAVKTTTTKPAKVFLTQPFGYIDKGTFFTDEHVTEFPQSIEVIYQVHILGISVS
jgi:hypothetical protein